MGLVRELKKPASIFVGDWVRALSVAACLCLWACPSAAQVRIVRGPTPIPGGDARAAGDISVVNDQLAFGLAVESPAPYGVPRGALVDLAPVADGHIGRDRVVFADFIPNNWRRHSAADRGPPCSPRLSTDAGLSVAR